MPFENWDAVGDALLRALGLLSDGDFLILGEPTADPLPGRGLFGRRARPAASRYVQVLRIQDLYTAECVGATSLGGTWEMSESTIERLRALGWRTPDETKREFGTVTPNFDMYVALTAAPTLAELLVASLDRLDAEPANLVLQTSS
ncbi:MAG: hypothetical protein ABWY19_14250 [Marmoricola sp.]